MSENKRFTNNNDFNDSLIHCSFTDNLTKKIYSITEWDSIVGLCNTLWNQTRRFEKHNAYLVKENEKLKSVNQELRNELKISESDYKVFNDVIDYADDLICFNLSEHYQRQWNRFCEARGYDLDLERRLSFMNVEELINELSQLPLDTNIQVSVHYDKCWHIQEADKIHYFEPGNWVTIRGEKGEF